jgi:hypothetical protein
MSASCSELRNVVSNLFMYLPAREQRPFFGMGSRLAGAG